MSTSDLHDIFRSELTVDLPALEAMVHADAYREMNDFAHKYKIRLHYLGYSECYELCLEIERLYREMQLETLKDHGHRLFRKLSVIDRAVNEE